MARGLIIAVAALTLVAIAPARADEARRETAKAFAVQWLGLMDRQQYDDAWRETSNRLRNRNPLKRFVRESTSDHRHRGAV